MIRLTGLTKTYQMGPQQLQVLKGINLHVARGEFVAIMGPSGSGKSTLMNVLGCLDRPSSGEYQLAGRQVAQVGDDDLALVRNKEIGFVFQTFNLLPRMTAVRNVEQPLLYGGVRGMERRRRAAEALSRVGLGERLGHRPNELSGGQRQRVAIARALVTSPSILLADEPTGNLDSRSGEEIMALFQDLHRDGATIVLVTHEPDIARHAQRIVVLKDGLINRDERVSEPTVARDLLATMEVVG